MTSQHLWSPDIKAEQLANFTAGTMIEHLDIVFTAIGPNWIEASMPVDHRTVQPYGILHGGATATLAETLGSMASHIAVMQDSERKAVGISLEIHHLSQATEGRVTGRVEPIRIGRTIHVWDIKIRRAGGKLISSATLTVKIL